MAAKKTEAERSQPPELVVITGLSGSGKGTVLKCLEDLGYYAVDNLPRELIPKFAELTKDSPHIRAAALVVDIRGSGGLARFPAIYNSIRRQVNAQLLFLEADEQTLVRRFSETRRPHPLGVEHSVTDSLRQERQMLKPVRELADHVINTSKFNVHELREMIGEKFRGGRDSSSLMLYVNSFGFRYGLPTDSDLVFDVRFLPNPNYVPALKRFNGKNRKVAQFIRSYPQTQEFLGRINELLLYLIPHYIEEGKSYLTISVGCTGGQHRSVMMAQEIAGTLGKAGYHVKCTHRDILKSKER
jgi:RNase adapter protein RapZ